MSDPSGPCKLCESSTRKICSQNYGRCSLSKDIMNSLDFNVSKSKKVLFYSIQRTFEYWNYVFLINYNVVFGISKPNCHQTTLLIYNDFRANINDTSYNVILFKSLYWHSGSNVYEFNLVHLYSVTLEISSKLKVLKHARDGQSMILGIYSFYCLLVILLQIERCKRLHTKNSARPA